MNRKPSSRENVEEAPNKSGESRGTNGRFLPGYQSPVKSPGRPAVAKAFRERCREFMDLEGWDILVGMAKTKGRDQRPAAELLAAYGYGKPTQPISGDESMPPVLLKMSNEDVRALADWALSEESAGGTE